MKRRVNLIHGSLALLSLLLCAAVLSRSTQANPLLQTCQVPADYGTVAAAVSDPTCDIIAVGKGSFPAQLLVDRDLTINGQGAGETLLDGQRSGRVIDVSAGSSLTLQDLSVVNGLSPFQQGSGIRQPGAGIRVDGGALLLRRVEVADNEGGSGAGIHALQSVVDIEASNIRDNQAAAYNAFLGGGALFIDGGSDVTITASTISGNHSLDRGGGIRIAHGTLAISDTEFANNAALEGGALDSSRLFDGVPPVVTIANSSFTGNATDGQPFAGSAVNNGHDAVMTIRDTVFANNQSRDSNIANDGQLTLQDSEVSGNAGDAVFNDYNGEMTIIQSTIHDTHTGEGGGYGTGIRNQGTLTIQGTVLQRNHSSDNGGAIYNSRSLTVLNSIFEDNESHGSASDIYSNGEGDVLIQNSAFLRTGPGFLTDPPNIANEYGYMVIENSSIINRGQSFGWAITNDEGEVHFRNSTISHISTEYGGAVLNDDQGLVVLSSSTIDNRHKGAGDASTLNSGGNWDPEFRIVNSIIRSRGLQDCGGYFAFTSLGHNVFSDDSCDSVNSDLTNTKVAMFPHLYNGGSSLVYWLLPGSVAIDAGRDDLCPSIDQLGTERPLDGDGDGSANCDIGAFEFDPAHPPQLEQSFLPAVIGN